MCTNCLMVLKKFFYFYFVLYLYPSLFILLTCIVYSFNPIQMQGAESRRHRLMKGVVFL